MLVSLLIDLKIFENEENIHTNCLFCFVLSVFLNKGGLSGCVEVCFTYPTDFVKIILQLDERSGKKRRFKNSFDVIRHTLRSYGILGVYRGFSVVFYGAIPKYMFRY